jgi:hypothetical protein
MKKRFALLLAFVAGSSVVDAAVRTVSNSGFPAQFTTITAAITASANGDTIYIYGSGVVYANFTLAKSLTLIGQASWPMAPAVSPQINTGTLSPGAEGSRIIGMQFNSAINVNCDDILIERCRVDGAVTMGGTGTRNNLELRHNYLQYVTLNNMENALIRNNIFNYGCTTLNTVRVSDKNTVTIQNNLVIQPSNSCGSTSFNISNATITNNILWGSGATLGSSLCYVAHNITWQTNNTGIPAGNIIGPGNLLGVDPLFTNAPDRISTNTYDHSLQALSPGKDAGLDGTDIGIFGGTLPWPNYLGLPRLPMVTSLTSTNSTIAVGGSLNVQIEGTKVD